LARSDSHPLRKFASLLHFPHRAMRCRIGIQRVILFGGRVRCGLPCPQHDTGRPSVPQPLYRSRPSSKIRRLDERIGSSASRIPRCTHRRIVVCVSLIPRSPIVINKSLRLSLKLFPSKCRPLNSASTGTNGCILASSLIVAWWHQNPPSLVTVPPGRAFSITASGGRRRQLIRPRSLSGGTGADGDEFIPIRHRGVPGYSRLTASGRASPKKPS
jgi:hypothetical protein